MRLIDADALIERTRAHGERIAYVESFVQDINEAPTVAMGDNHITIKWTPDIDRLARDVAYQGLNDFSFMGKSIREWAEIILEQTAMQWISIEDRLPEVGKEVLVLIPVQDVLVPDLGGLMGNDDWWWSTTTYNGMVKPVFWAEIPRCPAGWKWYAGEEEDND